MYVIFVRSLLLVLNINFLDLEYYQQEYFENIRFHITSVWHAESPFHHIDSVNCALRFLLAPNATAAEKGAKCSACKWLVSDLNYQ